MEIDKSVSVRLYEILLKGDLKDDSNELDLQIEEEDDEDQFPLECYYCAKLFFDKLKFEQHMKECLDKFKRKCNVDASKEVVKRAHQCTFDNCTKSFKKSAELRKHEVIQVKS